jgi:putative thiamine transport system ATP-binding protein
MFLELKDVQIFLEHKALFHPLTIKIGPGEVATVMGPSGCGKSTLLSAICGNLSGSFKLKGNILLDGRSILDVPMEERQIGLLFQDDLLFPHLDIAGNLAFALPPHTPKAERRERIANALSRADLEGFQRRDPATLSGGQRARVSLLRSLLAEPKALLLDEPFSKLDQQLKGQIREFVFEQVAVRKIPTLLVTHNRRDCPNDQLIDLTMNGLSDAG